MLLELNLGKIIQVLAKLLVRRVEETNLMTKTVDKIFLVRRVEDTKSND